MPVLSPYSSYSLLSVFSLLSAFMEVCTLWEHCEAWCFWQVPWQYCSGACPSNCSNKLHAEKEFGREGLNPPGNFQPWGYVPKLLASPRFGWKNVRESETTERTLCQMNQTRCNVLAVLACLSATNIPHVYVCEQRQFNWMNHCRSLCYRSTET